MKGRRRREIGGGKEGKGENDNAVFQLSIDTFKNHPKTMAW